MTNEPFAPQKRKYDEQDTFFTEGNAEASLNNQMHHGNEKIEMDGGEYKDGKLIPCGVDDCEATFTDIVELEAHYEAAHRHYCYSCSRPFPTSFLLDLHLTEQHDPLFKILAARNPFVYRCLLQYCNEKFDSPFSREQHLMAQHNISRDSGFLRMLG